MCSCGSFVVHVFVFFFFFVSRKFSMQKRVSNLGYAFVNFTSPEAAFRFYREFHGVEWDVDQNKKICQINVAQYQVSLSFQECLFIYPNGSGRNFWCFYLFSYILTLRLISSINVSVGHYCK